MLKSLELFGFKSFADRTRFDFSRGITCVVGPNGSGKSNVVDAIKWILGDQSPKSLRGKEMTDVIFNGSSSRKPAGLAEATLTFDNSTQMFAIDSAEVQVSRRIYRSGEAEYLINKTPARLKDIKDLLLGTGAGSSAYSIIEQGRVDALLQATTQNRRIVFEEAAGISRFKTRKVEAQRKLERVGQNLLRLGDIVQEVHGQLTTLRSQAAKAAKFRDYTEELRRLRIGLAADDFRAATAQMSQAEQELGTFAARLAELETAHQQVEQSQTGVEQQLALVEDRLREAERLAADNRQARASQETTLHHQSARQEELQAEATRLQQQQQELVQRNEEALAQYQLHADSLQQLTADLEIRRAQLERQRVAVQSFETAFADQRTRLERGRARQLDLLHEKSNLTQKTTEGSSQFAVLEAAQQKTASRQTHYQQESVTAAADLATQRARWEAAAGQLEQLREELQSLQLRRDELLTLHHDRLGKVSELREQRSAWQARKAVLEDLELRQEGLSIGVKEILARAKESNISPWNTVVGSVADLLTADLKHAALLEVALGSRAQLIVVTQLAPLVEYLNSGKCRIAGRVGFLSLSGDGGGWGEWALQTQPVKRLPSQAALLLELDGQPGVVARADRLVKATSEVPQLAERLLADTWITRTLEAALELARGRGAGGRFVTLQGELVEPHGTLFAGTVRSETALVSRKSELRGLRIDLQHLEQDLFAAEAAAGDGARLTAEAEEAVRTVQQQIEQDSGVLAEIRGRVQRQEEICARWDAEQALLLTESRNLVEELQRLELATRETRDALEHADQELIHLQTELAARDEQLRELEQSLQVEQRHQGEAQLALYMQEQAIQGVQETCRRLEQDRFDHDVQSEEAARRLQMVLTRQEQLNQHVAEVQAQIDKLSEQATELEQRAAEVLAEREAIRRNRQTLSERELQLRHDRRELQERQYNLELRTQTDRQKLDHLAERIREEFHCELTAAVAEGASALAPTAPAVAESTGAETATEAADGESPETAALPDRAAVEARIDWLRKRLKQIGQVSTESLKDLEELETRHGRLQAQLIDLQEAKASLEEIVRRINSESKRLFVTTFDQVRVHFQELFRKLFGGGDGDVVLEDPEDVLECGIDIVARPPGKELRSISLLSGGEKTLTAVALLLAIFQSKPSPFCILDEVDAALDEGNVERYMRVIQAFEQTTQFIVITHSKRTMTVADVLYGVTMQESGVSKRMSVRFDDVSEDGSFKSNEAA